MSQSSSGVKVSGIGLPTILGVTFIILKLCGVIQWEWIWVLSPFWIPLAMVLFILLIIAIIAVPMALVQNRTRRW